MGDDNELRVVEVVVLVFEEIVASFELLALFDDVEDRSANWSAEFILHGRSCFGIAVHMRDRPVEQRWWLWLLEAMAGAVCGRTY